MRTASGRPGSASRRAFGRDCCEGMSMELHLQYAGTEDRVSIAYYGAVTWSDRIPLTTKIPQY